METSYLLADIHDLSPIQTPLQSTQRIKYTCFNASQNFLVFGASSGGLYVFRREPCSFLQLLPNQEGGVVHVTISPNEKLFAFASVKGVVCILEKNSSGLGARRIFTSSEHLGVNVTSLQWNGQSNELFIGDQLGKVSVISLLPFMMKNMFNPPSCTVMVLDSRIVQMDWQGDLLLVSTLSRSYICNVTKERFWQIGLKPRDGEYGSCFYLCGDTPPKLQPRSEAVGGRFTSLGEGEKFESEELQYVKVYCARPGSRLWEVNVDGTVLNTHQFKQALAIPPTGIIKVPQYTDSSQECDNEPSKSTNNHNSVIWNNQSFNFCKLFVLAKKYLFTFKRDGVYVFDPEKANVVMWSNDVVDIIDAQILKDTIYLRTSCGKMYGILFTPLEKFLIRLYLRKHYALCAKLCEIHCQYLMKEVPSSSKLYLLADLGTKLSNDEITEKILPLLQEISKCAEETRSAKRLESGIFVVENLHFLSKEDSETTIPDLPQVKKNDRFKDKSRSLSVSPDRSRRKKRPDISVKLKTHRSDSSSSLPELGKKLYKGISVVANVRNVDEEEKCENSRKRSDAKKSFSKELFTSFDSSPETIQALKEIGQSVSSKISNSTKTLKEKWQVLEGKILGNEPLPELLDVRKEHDHGHLQEHDSPDSLDKNLTIALQDDSVTEDSLKKRSRPEVDISKLLITLKHIGSLKENEEVKVLIWKLCYEILIIYNKYISLLSSSNMDSVNMDVLENHDDPKVIMRYLLIEWCDKSFPFEDYFSPDIVKELSNRFCQSLQSKILLEWLEELIPLVECELHVEPLLTIYSQEAVVLDHLLRRVIVVCSDLLDPHSVLQCIKDSGMTCYYSSFCVVLDKYQAGALQQVRKESSLENTCWQWPLPLRLNAIFFMLQMNQIETCYMMGRNADLLDIWYLMLRLQEQQCNEHSCNWNRSYELFLTYLDRANDTEMIIQDLLGNELLLSITIMAFEIVNEKFGGSCKCGFPFPVCDANQINFSEIGCILSNHLWLTNHDRHQLLCEKVPILWKQMLKNTPPDNLKSVLPLLVQLGDFGMLEPLLFYMTPELWHQVLDMTLTVCSGQCLKCGVKTIPRKIASRICLSTISVLLVKNMGAKSALELLSNHSVSSGCGVLDERFYKSCIFSTIVDSCCDDLRADAIDLALISSESHLKKPLVSNELGKLLDEALALDLAKLSVPAGEASSPNHHWGAQINLLTDTCPCCALPLGSPALLQNTGLMAFQCGHVFHTVCLCKKSCPTIMCLLCNQPS